MNLGLSRLRRLRLPALLPVVLVLAACAAPSTAPVPADIPFGQGRIWQVEGDGILRSYVFGTMHSTDERLRELPPEVRQAFDAADAVAFEIADLRAAEAEVAGALLLPPGRQLEDILGAELFQRTASAVAPLGIPVPHLQRLRPWALIAVLAVPPGELFRQAQGQLVLDAWLEAEARRQEKVVHGLETPGEQLALFENLSEAEQITMVVDLVDNYSEIQGQYGRLFEAYLAGNMAALMAELDDLSRSSDPEAALRFRHDLVEDRNHIMVERVLPLMAEASTFVAVGAAHLPGGQGVLRLLEQHGYTVTRLY
ncbi:MAG: TraB/GumN family protein [Kiloniellaceae bacterium]